VKKEPTFRTIVIGRPAAFRLWHLYKQLRNHELEGSPVSDTRVAVRIDEEVYEALAAINTDMDAALLSPEAAPEGAFDLNAAAVRRERRARRAKGAR
jgi:hypothetical protein